MKYIALVLLFLLAVTYEGCGSRGIYVTIDGERHTFNWGGVD